MAASTKYLGRSLSLPQPLDFPQPQWSYQQRLAITRTRNAHHTTGRGTARRDRLEIRVLTKGMAALEAVWGPGATVKVGDGRTVPMQTVLYQRIALTPWALDLRWKIRGMLHWLSVNGPAARGWAFLNPLSQAERGPRSTGYYLPRRSEAVCRQWRGVLRHMLQLLRFLAKMWPRVIPVLRQGVESTALGVFSAVAGSGSAGVAVSRDQVVSDRDGWRGAADRLRRRVMGQEPA